MAGRYLNKRRVKISPIKKFTENSSKVDYYSWRYSDYIFHSENQRFLEEYSDGPAPETYPDQPYLFSSLPVRLFFSTGGEEFSTYTCTILAYQDYDKTQQNWDSLCKNLKTSIDYVIILMSKGAFAAGLYKENELVDTIEMHDRSEHMTPRDEKTFRNKVKAVLDGWNAAGLYKFIRCRREDFDAFGYNEAKYRCGLPHHKHMHIPFHTGYPTVSEVKQVNERLFSFVKYKRPGTTGMIYEKEMNQKVASKSSTLRSPIVRETLKMEPLVNPKTIRDLILKDDGRSLQKKLENDSTNSLFSDFLSSFHSVTDDSPFLHYAVTKDKPRTAEVLLDLGADPCQVDKNGKLPYELCRTDEMREIFIAKRDEFPDRFNWERAKVPTVDEYESILPPRIEPTKEFDSRPTRDAVRMKRKQKLDKKKIHKDDY